MKINSKELKKLFNDYLYKNEHESRITCPSFNELINIFTSNPFSLKRRKIIKHISKCPKCAEETKLIISIIKETDKLSKQANKIYSSLLDNSIKKNHYRHSSIIPALKFSIPFSIIIIGIILVFFFLQNRTPVLRGDKYPPVILISPINEIYDESIPVFNWEFSLQPDFFCLEIYDESLNLIWRSSKIFSTCYKLPINTLYCLKQNSLYYWSVTAFLPDSNKIESGLGRFKLSH